MKHVKHTAFLIILTMYILIVGQNWAWYAAALMLTAYVRNDGQSFTQT